MDFKNLFRKRRAPADPSLVDAALGTEAERLRQVDAETERQWHAVKIALERSDARKDALREPVRFTFRPALALGVAVLMLAIAGVFLFQAPVRKLTYTTGKGELSTVLLPDSSEVTLNHTSELLVVRPSGAGARHVVLRGEAFFRVRTGREPFIVSTDDGTVQVLGTQFNVRVRGTRLEVGVVSGSVSVAGGSDGEGRVVLPAGTMVTHTKGSGFSLPEKILFAEYPGWINRKLLFQRSTVQSVCSEIEARFDLPVRIQNPGLLDETVTGALDSRTAEGAVATLAALTGCKYRHEANGFSLY